MNTNKLLASFLLLLLLLLLFHQNWDNFYNIAFEYNVYDWHLGCGKFRDVKQPSLSIIIFEVIWLSMIDTPINET